MSIPRVTESTIRQSASRKSFLGGEDCYDSGAVGELVLRGESLQAEVAGSHYEPYRVHVSFDEAGIPDAYCSCPYDWGGWCRHVVAVLLAYLHDPDGVEQRPELATLIRQLVPEQLEALLLALASDPELARAIERQLSLVLTEPKREASPPIERRMLINAQSFRERAYSIMHSLDHMPASQAYWHIGDLLHNLKELADEAQPFIENGDGINALRILEAVTEVYVSEWMILDASSGESGEFFDPLGKRWIEAALSADSADLSAQERQAWANKLEAWQSQISQHAIDDAFVGAVDAIREGWNDNILQKFLQGDPETPDHDAQTHYYTHEVALTRLKVLERQARYDEYLRLAKVMPQAGHYLTMLVRLGRIEEAVAYALQKMSTPGEALTLAHALRDRKRLDAALRIAEHGLTLNNGGSNPYLTNGSYDATFSGSKAMLATWLCDLAQGMGQQERALVAADIAFRESPNLHAYLKVKELAHAEWPPRRAQLLQYLRQHAGYIEDAQVDIFLHEGLVDEAIHTVNASQTDYSLLEKVMRAALQTRPQWVIQTAQKQAEEIMDSGKSKQYQHAIKWLQHAQAAYQAAQWEAQWHTYLLTLCQKHRRKYKLIGLLKAL